MKILYEEIKKEVSLIENSYDIIRVVDILNKKSRIIKEDNFENFEEISCYDFWGKGLICNNCISTRAYYEKNTIVKIKYVNNKIFLITATPLYTSQGAYVLELLKDISQNNSNNNTNNNTNIDTVINKINNTIITDPLTKIYNKEYVIGRLPIDINTCVINNQPLSIIMINIDFLNNINSKNFNTAKYDIMKNLSEIFYNSIETKTNWIAEYSTSSFLIVLNNTDKETASNILNKIESLSLNIFSKYKKYMNLKITPSFNLYHIEDEKVDINKILVNIDKNLNPLYKKNDNIIPAYTNITNNNSKSSFLKSKIEELRNILDEMCITTDETVDYPQILETSQYLDELIVEYMKSI